MTLGNGNAMTIGVITRVECESGLSAVAQGRILMGSARNARLGEIEGAQATQAAYEEATSLMGKPFVGTLPRGFTAER